MINPIKNEKGEGLIKLILILAILGGSGYFALQYFGIIGDKPSATTAAAASPTPAVQGGNGADGSLAAQQVQGAEALGEMSSGR